jgi:hypothetical protein
MTRLLRKRTNLSPLSIHTRATKLLQHIVLALQTSVEGEGFKADDALKRKESDSA